MKRALAILCLLTYSHAYCQTISHITRETDLRHYVSANNRHLTRNAVRELQNYFARRSNMYPFVPIIEKLGARPEVRIITFGESHGPGFLGTKFAEKTSLEILKVYGYNVLFLEVMHTDQPYLDAFLKNKISAREVIRNVESLDRTCETILDTAKRLGYQIVAIDTEKRDGNERERDAFMFATATAYLDAHTSAKAVIIVGAHHAAQTWYEQPDYILPLARFLHVRYGDALVTIHISPDEETNYLIREVYGEHGARGRMFRSNIESIASIPCWFTDWYKLLYPDAHHIMRFGDWDWWLIEPNP